MSKKTDAEKAVEMLTELGGVSLAARLLLLRINDTLIDLKKILERGRRS